MSSKIELKFENFEGYIDVDDNNYTVIKQISYISDGKRGRRKEEDKPKVGENKIKEEVLGHCSSLDKAINVIIRNVVSNKDLVVNLKGYITEYKSLIDKLTKQLV
jgi:hypothetical protein